MPAPSWLRNIEAVVERGDQISSIQGLNVIIQRQLCSTQKGHDSKALQHTIHHTIDEHPHQYDRGGDEQIWRDTLTNPSGLKRFQQPTLSHAIEQDAFPLEHCIPATDLAPT